ncbi:MAG: radical SAM protein [Deltaproteobacteria bacterium]|nr:radical SAM protein [Deltaproteobacteria bacterium]
MIDPHLEGIARGTPFAGPKTLHVDVTNGCNTNCVTCWDHSPHLSSPRPSAWKRQRVAVAEIEALVDDVMRLGGLEAVIVSGMGEPFTHPEIYELLAALKARDLHVTVITNLVPADPERVVALGVDQLLIGVHAASEPTYRAFHPSFERDEWWRLLAALARFRRAGRPFKHVQVIAGCNAHELLSMIDFAAEWGAAQVNFKLASLGHGTEAARITEAQRARLRDDVPAAVERARAHGVPTNLDVFARQLDAGGGDTAPIEDIGCYMGFVYARVLVDGTVLFCCNTEVRVGSLAEAPFSELWRGDAWNALRDRMRARDYLPSCRQCGKVVQNVKWARALEKRRLPVVAR